MKKMDPEAVISTVVFGEDIVFVKIDLFFLYKIGLACCLFIFLGD